MIVVIMIAILIIALEGQSIVSFLRAMLTIIQGWRTVLKCGGTNHVGGCKLQSVLKLFTVP